MLCDARFRAPRSHCSSFEAGTRRPSGALRPRARPGLGDVGLVQWLAPLVVGTEPGRAVLPADKVGEVHRASKERVERRTRQLIAAPCLLAELGRPRGRTAVVQTFAVADTVTALDWTGPTLRDGGRVRYWQQRLGTAFPLPRTRRRGRCDNQNERAAGAQASQVAHHPPLRACPGV
jgi:hypothetical protein